MSKEQLDEWCRKKGWTRNGERTEEWKTEQGYTERDKQFWNNGKYWLKDSFAIRTYLIPRIKAQLEVATKPSIVNRLTKEKERLEQRLALVKERIKQK